MSWRMAMQHVTRYEYPRDVLASYNEARVTPLSTDVQLTIDARLHVHPAVRVGRYWDYWGALVHTFDIHVPHRELVVTSTAVVETPAVHGRPLGEEASWHDLDDDDLRDQFYEYLAPTAAVPAEPDLVAVAAGLRSSAAAPSEAVAAASDWVREQLVYEPGTTNVHTSAVEAWRARRGVCQDYAHLTLGLLRAMGVPGRYVSGYFHPWPEAAIGETVVGESHAWVEAWLGEWQPLDPTNDVTVGERHVVVARARDYGDVTPVHGVYSGAASATPEVSVALTRRA